MTENPMVRIDSVRKLYGIYTALDDVCLDIRPGEFFSLLGPSGCGKTTLLRSIAGFETPSAGDISIDGHSVIDVPPNRRPTNMVFQSYAIFPHLDIEENVGYGLRRLKLDRAEEARRIGAALEQVRLGHLAKRRANELSGGQRQRVALARALVLRPKVLLLDEPLSALDKNLREEMQVELRSLQKEVGITFVLVTHDQYEAMALSDRIAVMFEGKVAQTAAAKDIYQRPRTKMVAHFLGGMNFLSGKAIRSSSDALTVEVEKLGMLSLQKPESYVSSGNTVTVGIRPENLRLLGDRDSADFAIAGQVLNTTYFGQSTQILVGVEGLEQPLSVLTPVSEACELSPGSAIRLAYRPEDMVVVIDDATSTRQ